MPTPGPTPTRLPIIGIMGSGDADSHYGFAGTLGALVAEMGFNLLTGGGYGVMTDASKAFYQTSPRDGQVIGILPVQEIMTRNVFEQYPNPYVEINIQTHLLRQGGPDDPFTRNHINILTANALIFCPGSAGTHCELDLAKKYGTPSLLFMGDNHTIDGMSQAQLKAYGFPMAKRLDDARSFLENFMP
jgi:uncharacterized protein (TIGR00725 family)